jgi:conjugal transfer pilus assembly protein TraW
MIIRLIAATLLVALLPLSHPAKAEDLGVVGPTYETSERDVLELITSTLKRMEQTGELAKYQEDYKNKVVSSIEHPRPVTGFKATGTASTHFYDPSMVMQKDILDATGKVLYARGTQVNPLDYIGWNTYLLFVDGRDEKQLTFSKKVVATSDRPVKIVLVAGEPLALMRKWKSSVYFDQGGKLIKRFAITQVPAIVRQEGKRLRVDELRY